MGLGIDKIWQMIGNQKESNKPTYAKATVLRKDSDGVIWVRIEGGVDETPTYSTTANVKPNDVVTVKVAGGKVYIEGSTSSPSVGVTEFGDTISTVNKNMGKVDEKAGKAAEDSEAALAAAKAAEEAADVAKVTGQHFWVNDDESETYGGAGAHVTEQEKDDWVDAVQRQFPDLSDQKPYHNILMNSLGILLRTALNNLVSITRSSIAFFDGIGNNAANIVASFGKDGSKIGLDNESHVEIDYHSMQMIDREGHVYMYISDLRDETGIGTIVNEFAGDGVTRNFYLSPPAMTTDYVVTYTMTNHPTYTKYNNYVSFSVPPTKYDSVTVTYQSDSIALKAYTFGMRGSAGRIGPLSVAEGEDITATGAASHAEGYMTQAVGHYSHSENYHAQAYGYASHAEGDSTKASGNASHAEGRHAEALGKQSHAEGSETKASNDYAHVEGFYTTASGRISHAEGYYTTASGDDTHAEGTYTTASGYSSHAEGVDATASGYGSHAQNGYTKASSSFQTAIGKFNIEDANGTYALIIGNGTADNARSNVLTVDWNGRVVNYAGDYKIKQNSVKRGTTPSSDRWFGGLEYYDEDDNRIGIVELGKLASGYTSLWMRVSDNTSQAQGGFCVKHSTGNTATHTMMFNTDDGWLEVPQTVRVANLTQYKGNAIEFYPPANNSEYGGFIDFHYNQSSADYTSRIWENASGRITIEGSEPIWKQGSTTGLAVKSSNVNQASPSGSKWTCPTTIYDSAGNLIGHDEYYQNSSGTLGHNFAAVRQKVNGTWNWYQCSINVQTNGTVTYSISNPAAFRNAIGEAGTVKATLVSSYVYTDYGSLTCVRKGDIVFYNVNLHVKAFSGRKQIATVPAGYRPTAALYAFSTTGGYVIISTGGDVQYDGGSDKYLYCTATGIRA